MKHSLNRTHIVCMSQLQPDFLAKETHTHKHTHTHTRKYPCSVLCVFTQINACRRCTGSEFTHIYAIWFVHYENDKDLNFTHRLSPTPPLPLNRTCCVCMCVCVCVHVCTYVCVCVCAHAYVQVCLGLARQQSSLRLHTHRKAQSNNKGLSKEPSAG